jgi:hypothetical protein
MSERLIIPPPAAANQQLVTLARQFLSDVEAGRVQTAALITVSPLGGINTPAFGPQGSELYLGADLLKAMILNAMQGSRGGIVRAN